VGDQWADRKRQFGKLIDEVVPFMPMEQARVESVLALKLADYSRMGGSAGTGPSASAAAGGGGEGWWRGIVVNADVITHLSGPTYLKYVNFTGTMHHMHVCVMSDV